VLAAPSVYKDDTLNVLTAAGFYQFNDTLVAYYGEYSPYKTNIHLWAKITTDGEHWSEAINMHIVEGVEMVSCEWNRLNRIRIS